MSVVIPTRDRVSLLRRAMESALRQTERDIEVIVVDDGSGDSTPDYLGSLRDPRVKAIFNAKPLGGAAARNVGIAAATGRWIAFLDDDDEWLADKLALQMEALEKNPHAVACSSAFIQHRIFGRKTLVRVPRTVTFADLLEGSVMGGASVCVCDAATVRSIGGFDERLRSGQDWDLWTRLSRAGAVIGCPEPTVSYDGRHGPRISVDMEAQYQGVRRVYFKYRREMSAATRARRLGHLCFVMSRQESRPLRRRLFLLRLAVAHSRAGTALRYVISSAPRMLGVGAGR